GGGLGAASGLGRALRPRGGRDRAGSRGPRPHLRPRSHGSLTAMRLLLTTDTVGGVWDYSLTLARALEAEGHALLLAVIGTPSDDQLASLPEGIAIECRNHALEWLLVPTP